MLLHVLVIGVRRLNFPACRTQLRTARKVTVNACLLTRAVRIFPIVEQERTLLMRSVLILIRDYYYVRSEKTE